MQGMLLHQPHLKKVVNKVVKRAIQNKTSLNQKALGRIQRENEDLTPSKAKHTDENATK